MTDAAVLPKSYTQFIVGWLKSPQGIMAMQVALAPSGVIGIKLAHWFGLDPDQLGWLANEVIQFAPFIVVGTIQLARSTHRAIITQVAQILAERQLNGQPSGTIIINASAADGAAKAVNDPALTNVVSAGSTEAIQAATTTK